MTEQAFWIPEGDDRFRATMHTQGPWDARFQHGGPPGALLVRQIEHCSPRPDMILARISIDILGPIPITTLHAHAHLTRPGRSVELLEASLEHDGRTIMRASAWRIRVPTERPPAEEPAMPPALPSQEGTATIAPEWQCGFLAATEWRYVVGAPGMVGAGTPTIPGTQTQPGAATAWIRMRYPLIAGEVVTPAQRLILSADSANGMSSPLDIRFWQFIPPELTIHCLRPPLGEWICVDASTLLQSEGVGLTSANLYDEQGLVGRSAQALLISQRIQKK